MPNATKTYYIQTGYQGNAILWLGKESKGYTTDIEEAGVYTHQQAMRIIQRDKDKAWLCEHVDNCTAAHKKIIHSQYLDPELRIENPAQTLEKYDIDNLKHMVGASDGIPKKKHGNRNYFSAGRGGKQEESMQRLLEIGFVIAGTKTETLTYYHATVSGCVAINLHRAAILRAIPNQG